MNRWNELQLGSQDELLLAFYVIWNSYQLTGTAGRSISTYYLSEIPDYAVYRWLNTAAFAQIRMVEQGEEVFSRVRND